MAKINRTHKDSCKNARVLLPLTDSHGVQSGTANARCRLSLLLRFSSSPPFRPFLPAIFPTVFTPPFPRPYLFPSPPFPFPALRPSQTQLGSLGECCELPQRGPGRSPGRQRISVALEPRKRICMVTAIFGYLRRQTKNFYVVRTQRQRVGQRLKTTNSV